MDWDKEKIKEFLDKHDVLRLVPQSEKNRLARDIFNKRFCLTATKEEDE